MFFFYQIIIHTPLWVWLILAALLTLGLRRTRTRTTSQIGILVPAFIFGAIAIVKLALGHFAQPALLGTAAGVVAAFILLNIVRPGSNARKQHDGLYVIRGEWFSLALILLVFFVNYGLAIIAAMNPVLAASDNARFAYGFINALSAGFMIGRAICYLRAPEVQTA